MGISTTCLLLLLSGVSAAMAQGTPLRAGERVRVVTQVPWCTTAQCKRPETRLIGSLRSLSPDTMVLGTARGRAALPRGVVAPVDTFAGRGRWTTAGAIVGLLVGSLTGTAIGAAASLCVLEPCTQSDGPVVAGAFVGAGAGALLGALVGSLFGRDRWRSVLMYEPGRGLVPTGSAGSASHAGRVGADFLYSF